MADLVPPHAYVIRTGRDAPRGLYALSGYIADLNSAYESAMNRAIEAAKGFASAKLISDLECNVEAITDAGAEFVSLVRHVAEEAGDNARQPVERERAS